MVTLYILAGILLLFILLFTVHAYITIDMQDEFTLSVRALGIRIPISPKKQKKYKPSRYTLKKIRKREAKAAKKKEKADAAKIKKAKAKAEKKEAKAKLTKAERKALRKDKRAKRPAMTDFIPLTARVSKLFFSRFFGKLRIRTARLHIRVGTDNAAKTAVMFAVIRQSVAGLMTVLRTISHVDGLKKADIAISPDFTSDKITFDCKLTFRVSLGNIVGAALKAGLSFLFGYHKIKPDPDQPRESIFPEMPELPDLPDAPPLPDAPESPF